MLLVALAACDESGSHVHQAFNLAAQKGDLRALERMLAVDPSLARTPWIVTAKRGGRWVSFDRLPLLAAAREGRVEVVRFLLDHGAAIEGIDETQATALIHAASSGHPDVVRLLLERGASTAARNADGHGALDRTLLLPDGLSAVLLCAHGDTATLRADRNRFLSAFVEPGGGCAELKQTWDETPASEREALLLDQVCRVDAYACKALRSTATR